MRIIDSVIPFCSYSSKFVNRTIDGVRPISKSIYVVYSDKLASGEKDDENAIELVKKENPDCNFVKIDYFKSMYAVHQRYIGYSLSTADYLLFVDADEVFEKDRLSDWVNNKSEFLDVTSFANYWYFRSEDYQATKYEDSPVMVKRSSITQSMLFHSSERGIYKYSGLECELGAKGFDGKPMCHHYSWALNKEEMLVKVKNWSHKNDRNWQQLIEDEFSRDFSGTDFVHGYSYLELKNV